MSLLTLFGKMKDKPPVLYKITEHKTLNNVGRRNTQINHHMLCGHC